MFFLSANVFAEDLKSPLVDSAGMIESRKVPEVVSALEALRRERDIWLVVWTVPDLAGESIESVAVNQFKKWRVGAEKKDNGLLLVIAAKERKMKLEVGYGLEGDIPDIRAKQLLDTHLKPQLKRNDLAAGVLQLIADLNGKSAESAPKSGASQPAVVPDEIRKHVIDFTGTLDQQTLDYMYNQIQWKAKEGIDLWLYFSGDERIESSVDHKNVPANGRRVVLFLNTRDQYARLLNTPDFADQKFWDDFTADLSRAMKKSHLINALGSTNGTMEIYLRRQSYEKQRQEQIADSSDFNRKLAMLFAAVLALVSFSSGYRFEKKIIRLEQYGLKAADQTHYQKICERFFMIYKKIVPLSAALMAALSYFFLKDANGVIPTIILMLLGPLVIGAVAISGWAYRQLYSSKMSDSKKQYLNEILGKPGGRRSSGGGYSSSGSSYSSSSSSSSSSSYSGGGRSGGGGASSDW